MAIDNSTEKNDSRAKLWRRLAWRLPVIVLLVGFAIWWQLRQEKERQIAIETQSMLTKANVAYAGIWSGELTYAAGAKATETFFFQPEGNNLFGTATFLGEKLGIEDGKITGETFTFFIRLQEHSDGAAKEYKNLYSGKLNGREIRLRMQDDRGNPAVEWVVRKIDRIP